MFEDLQGVFLGIGPVGILLGSLLESSIIPIPSELFLLTAGLAGFSPIEVAIWGGVGSTLGAVITYAVGKYWGRLLIEKIGRYLLLTPRRLRAIDKWFEKFGDYAVLISRLVPLIPHKVFSIISGIGNMSFKRFILFTLIGSVPRAFMLAYFGNILFSFQNLWVTILSIIIVFLIPSLFGYYNHASESSG